MRKAISLLVLLAFGNSLWANDNAQDVRDRDNQRPKIVVEKRHTATRTESYLAIYGRFIWRWVEWFKP